MICDAGVTQLVLVSVMVTYTLVKLYYQNFSTVRISLVRVCFFLSVYYSQHGEITGVINSDRYCESLLMSSGFVCFAA